MTVESTGPRANYIASGSAVFAYNWLCLASGDMVVYDNGVLVSSSNYTVSGLGVSTGGNVTFAVAPSSGHVINLLSGAAYTQPSNIDGGTTISLTALETAHDRQTVLVKQVKEITDRSPAFAPYSCSLGVTLAEPVAGQFLRWADATHIDSSTPAGTSALSPPILLSQGGTGVSAASNAALRNSLAIATWGTTGNLTPVAGVLTLPNPLTGNYIEVQGGNISTIDATGLAAGTVITLVFEVGSNVLSHLSGGSGLLSLMGARNYTTTTFDRLTFIWDGSTWNELARQPAVTTANSSLFLRGDGVWASAAIGGCGLSNNAGDATNDIDIAVGARWSDDSTHSYINLASALTKRLDATWVVGTNQGMLASGAALTNTTYHLFLIMRPDTGVVDVAADTSATGANLAANTAAAYTRKWRIGSILREGGVIVPFSQVGAEFMRKTAATVVTTGTNPGTSAVTLTLTGLPTGLTAEAIFSASQDNDAVGTLTRFSDLALTDQAPSQTAAPLAHQGVSLTAGAIQGAVSGPHRIRMNTSAQIRVRLSASAANTIVRVSPEGWIDQPSQG